MYHATYASIVEDQSVLARANEWQALDRAVTLLELARPTPTTSAETKEAITFVGRLWSMLLEDLASAENSLPDQLRASLISIGIWMLKEVDRLRLGQSDDVDTMIDVNRMIRDSLA